MLIQTSHLGLVTATRFACDCYPMTFFWWPGGATSVCHKDEGETAHTPAPSSHTHDERLDRWWELYQKGSQVNNPSARGNGKRKTYMVHLPYRFISPTVRFTTCKNEWLILTNTEINGMFVLGQRHTTVFQSLFVSSRGDMLSYPILDRP